MKLNCISSPEKHVFALQDSVQVGAELATRVEYSLLTPDSLYQLPVGLYLI